MLWPYLLLLAAFASASDRSDKLAKLTAAGSVLRLNSATYDEFTAGARDYSLSVVLTALGPQFKCQPCQQFQPAHREVARQFRRKARQPDHKHFFAYLDFPDGQETFRKVGLSLCRALC
jgi:oligosaccharyltransferase complex subunit gamma